MIPSPPTSSRHLGARVLAFVGPSGSGKTELICRLLSWLDGQGLQVAVLKHSHKLNLGEEGKDTWRYRQAGGQMVALAAPGLLQITRYFPGEPPLTTALAQLTPGTDLILVEGYKSSTLPKIAVLGQEEVSSMPDYPHLIAVVSALLPTSDLPIFHPDQVEEIGRLVLKYLGLNDAAPTT